MTKIADEKKKMNGDRGVIGSSDFFFFVWDQIISLSFLGEKFGFDDAHKMLIPGAL